MERVTPSLAGRVVIITGAGRGLGREHALLFAREGAKVVVNDIGTALDGSGRDASVAQQVADEIRSAGGEAVANTDDVADFAGAQRLVEQAIDTFGDLHALVNNAGSIRDRMFVNMSEKEWDAVIRIHLKGHFAPSRWAAGYWRDRARSGATVRGSIVNTTSHAGLVGQPGQSNYGAAKAGIAGLTINLAAELERYGVRVNAISPAARTRLTESNPPMQQMVAPPADAEAFDVWHPANISPLAAYLATADCPVTGRVFWIKGGELTVMRNWADGPSRTIPRRWTVLELAQVIPSLLDQ
jgi:NAD(P)-dependent dehydrogenase (short-subunit alcohol dehydrogenase family)